MVVLKVMLNLLTVINLAGGMDMNSDINFESEMANIREVIENSIGWAQTKDTTVLYNCFVQDSSLFFFNPDNAGNIDGFDSFRKLTEGFFMQDGFKAVSFKIKDMKLGISQSGKTAWWSCYLDDFNEYNGQPANWVNVRWSGVLDKIDDQWKIMQMHFSHAIEDFRSDDNAKP